MYMPQYINRTIEEVVSNYRCPFCLNEYKTKTAVKNHAKKCNDNYDIGESLDNIFVDENITANEIIQRQDEITHFTKLLTINNDLAKIQTQTPEEIRNNIKQSLRQKFNNDYYEVGDIYRIYEFFFGLTEADKINRINENYLVINKHLTPTEL